MRFDEFKRAFEAGELPKPYYLGAVFAATRPLFELQQALRGGQVREVVVSEASVRIRTRLNDLELIFDAEEVSSLVTGLLAFGDTESAEREVLLTAARRAGTILDIGANVGWYSLHFSRVAPQARIVAFEPMPQIHARLLEHLRLNGATQVEPERIALQDQEGEGVLYFHKAETGATSARNNRGFDGALQEAVPTTTLDRYCSERGIEPELIKCDVEGSEFAVVRGGRETIRRCRPIIFLELLRKWSANFGYHPNEVIDELAGAGYETWAIEQQGGLPRCPRITDETVATNFLFVVPELHHDYMDELRRRLAAGAPTGGAGGHDS